MQQLYFKILKKYSPISNLGFDKEGDLIKYIDIGRADSPGLINSCKKVDIVKYNLQVNEIDLEKLRQQSKKLGKTVNRITFIYNFDKMTFAKVTNKKALDIMVLGATMYQDNYPECIKYIYFINSSIYFTMVFSILKQFLAPHLIEKIRVFGTDGYQESLIELADADIIPASLGGNRTDSDGNPNCYEIITYGEDVPRELYFRKSERRLSSSPGAQKLTVTRFSKSDIRFEVREPGSLLEWEFETKNRDIGFGVYFQGSPDSKIEELVPKQRIETEVEPETGVYKCVKAGTYIIVFDNSYSWLYPKHIFYRARIISPHDEESIPWK
ncbi:hypothetical protein JTE90_022756 [Oedothorax gibbosus]|uniref:SEC14-like protein 2 n=1 Tax=Oedothorax gibbosus TaxID=931172 RepID=A0AAV6U8M5_9ARAC|nr:hypothetical protein JTE90_022756 [Oedothorax gibbosus]